MRRLLCFQPCPAAEVPAGGIRHWHFFEPATPNDDTPRTYPARRRLQMVDSGHDHARDLHGRARRHGGQRRASGHHVGLPHRHLLGRMGHHGLHDHHDRHAPFGRVVRRPLRQQTRLYPRNGAVHPGFVALRKSPQRHVPDRLTGLAGVSAAASSRHWAWPSSPANSSPGNAVWHWVSGRWPRQPRSRSGRCWAAIWSTITAGTGFSTSTSRWASRPSCSRHSSRKSGGAACAARSTGRGSWPSCCSCP